MGQEWGTFRAGEASCGERWKELHGTGATWGASEQARRINGCGKAP